MHQNDKAIETSSASQQNLADPTEIVLRLSPRQQVALHRLFDGATIRDAAEAAGVDRRSVHRWIREDYNFCAAYNDWRRELLSSGRARALTMSDLALNTVKAAMEKGDGRLALRMAEKIGLLESGKIGSADPLELSRHLSIQQTRLGLKFIRAEKKLGLENGSNAIVNQRMDEWIAYSIDRRCRDDLERSPQGTPPRTHEETEAFESTLGIARLFVLVHAHHPKTPMEKKPPKWFGQWLSQQEPDTRSLDSAPPVCDPSPSPGAGVD
jgi:hypothetical protein